MKLLISKKPAQSLLSAQNPTQQLIPDALSWRVWKPNTARYRLILTELLSNPGQVIYPLKNLKVIYNVNYRIQIKQKKVERRKTYLL